MEHKLIRCESDDPNRCKAVGSEGQCPFLAEPECANCLRHGANKTMVANEQKRMSVYRIAKWQERINAHANAPGLKSLREEVGVLRILFEETVEKCQTTDDLLMNSTRISELTKDIDKLLCSCIKIEMNSGQTLDKTMAMNFASQVIQVIGKHISDEPALDAIANEILEMLKSL